MALGFFDAALQGKKIQLISADDIGSSRVFSLFLTSR